MKQKNNIWEVFRGVAALLVMFHHYTERYDGAFGHLADWPVQSLYGGQFGVCMFFIFTGMFLLPSMMRSRNYLVYLKKRALRLYPYYIPCVIITFLCMKFTPPLSGRETTLGDFIANLTMFQSYLGFKNVDGAYWTLSVQLLVYLIMGGIFFILRKNKRMFLTSVLIWFAVDICLSIYGKVNGIVPMSSVLLVRTIHLFLQGILIWLLSCEENKFTKVLMTVILFVSPLYNLFHNSIYYTIFNFLIVAIIFAINIKGYTYSKENIFTFLGSISFVMYLLHQNIGFLIIRYIESIGLTHEIFILIPVAIVILLSWGVTSFVNKLIINKI